MINQDKVKELQLFALNIRKETIKAMGAPWLWSHWRSHVRGRHSSRIVWWNDEI